MTKYLLNLVCIVGIAGAAHAGAVANLEITEQGHAYLVFADGGLGQLTGYTVFDSQTAVVDGTPTLAIMQGAPEDGTGQYATAWAPLMDQGVPTDALVYRFHDIIQVYGTTLKAVIEEEFGDGIMSAIDFSMDMERVPDPKGDRVKITMNGKFLPYKRY